VIDDLCDFGECFLDRSCDLRIFVVDDARYLQRLFRVKALGCFVLAFGRKVLE